MAYEREVREYLRGLEDTRGGEWGMGMTSAGRGGEWAIGGIGGQDPGGLARLKEIQGRDRLMATAAAPPGVRVGQFPRPSLDPAPLHPYPPEGGTVEPSGTSPEIRAMVDVLQNKGEIDQDERIRLRSRMAADRARMRTYGRGEYPTIQRKTTTEDIGGRGFNVMGTEDVAFLPPSVEEAYDKSLRRRMARQVLERGQLTQREGEDFPMTAEDRVKLAYGREAYGGRRYRTPSTIETRLQFLPQLTAGMERGSKEYNEVLWKLLNPPRDTGQGNVGMQMALVEEMLRREAEEQ
jgi:hypothetical protein